MQRDDRINLIRVEPAAGKSPFIKQTGIVAVVMDKQDIFTFYQHGPYRVRTTRFTILDFGFWILDLHYANLTTCNLQLATLLPCGCLLLIRRRVGLVVGLSDQHRPAFAAFICPYNTLLFHFVN